MSAAIVKKIRAEFGDAVLEDIEFRSEFTVVVDAKSWKKVAAFLRDELAMNHFNDLTAVDYPERQGARFDVVLRIRAHSTNERICIKTRIAQGVKIDSLFTIWAGANWAEREVYDMFGIQFAGHPDMRRILMYEEFEGFPLLKDYPIDRAQPLVEYRATDTTTKLGPFGIEEGQPFGRIQWDKRLSGSDNQVSPSIASQVGQSRNISDSEIARSEAEAQTEAASETQPSDGAA